MKRATIGFFLLSALLLCAWGCATKGSAEVPPDGTRVTTQSEVFRRAASDLREDCAQIGGCTCFLDGLQTSCSLVFACLDVGFCELARD